MDVMKRYPSGFGRMLAAADFVVGPSREIALVGEPASFLAVLRRHYLPRTVVAAGSDAAIPLLNNRPSVNGSPTAYVCENYSCKNPVTDPSEFERQLA
jgi:uncharacterized protein YyaL (SSP411 family)